MILEPMLILFVLNTRGSSAKSFKPAYFNNSGAPICAGDAWMTTVSLEEVDFDSPHQCSGSSGGGGCTKGERVPEAVRCAYYCNRKSNSPCMGFNYRNDDVRRCDFFSYVPTNCTRQKGCVHYSASDSQIACQTPCWSNNTLFLTVDNYPQKIYINGYPVEFDKTFYGDWMKAKSLPLPCDVVTIAMLVENALFGPAGLLVWDSNGIIVSNSHWKCSNVLTIGWMNNLFNDSAWPAAVELARYGSGVWSTAVTNYNGPGPTSASFWIWFSESIDGTGPVYCRIKFPKP